MQDAGSCNESELFVSLVKIIHPYCHVVSYDPARNSCVCSDIFSCTTMATSPSLFARKSGGMDVKKCPIPLQHSKLGECATAQST